MTGTPVAVLSAEEKDALLRLSRETLIAYLSERPLSEFNTDSPALCEKRATFVTLRRRDTGELRGCRGEYRERQALFESVVNMTIAAATDDPRFPPVHQDEVPVLQVEISALTPIQPIRPEDVVVGRHGLLIRLGPKAGLLLPQVAETYQWGRVEFLRQVCRKAGLAGEAWQTQGVELHGFECEVWGEAE